MNFYKRHLGDIAKATGHLSQGEMGAYDLLLDWIYSNEKPLPDRTADLHRIGRAATKQERANVDRVIGEFFHATPDGYMQKRATAEIEHAAEISDSARRSAQARWDRSHSEDDAKRMRNACETHSDRNASQTPEAKEQKNQSSLRSDSASSADDAPQPATLEQRLAEVTHDAIEAFNATLAKPHGLLPAVNPKVGIEKRRGQVKRCLRVARQICQEQFGAPTIAPAFWAAYWAEVNRDEFKSGRQEPGRGHENWTPHFEYLTREAVMLEVFDRAMARAPA